MSTIACWPRQLLLMLGLCLSPSTLAATLLANALWQVQIDPATLAVQVTPADRASVQASTGLKRTRSVNWSEAAIASTGNGMMAPGPSVLNSISATFRSRLPRASQVTSSSCANPAAPWAKA